MRHAWIMMVEIIREICSETVLCRKVYGIYNDHVLNWPREGVVWSHIPTGPLMQTVFVSYLGKLPFISPTIYCFECMVSLNKTTAVRKLMTLYPTMKPSAIYWSSFGIIKHLGTKQIEDKYIWQDIALYRHLNNISIVGYSTCILHV